MLGVCNAVIVVAKETGLLELSERRACLRELPGGASLTHGAAVLVGSSRKSAVQARTQGVLANRSCTVHTSVGSWMMAEHTCGENARDCQMPKAPGQHADIMGCTPPQNVVQSQQKHLKAR